MAEDGPQPGRHLLLGAISGRSLDLLKGFQQCLLDNPREVNPVAQSWGNLEPGQEGQISAEPLQILRG